VNSVSHCISYKHVTSEFGLQIKVGKELGINTAVAITRMESPLGRKIGNALEVEESIDTLKGCGPPDIEELVAIEGEIFYSGLKKPVHIFFYRWHLTSSYRSRENRRRRN
jgi:hypothetical protein